MSVEIHTLPVDEFLGLRIEECEADLASWLMRIENMGGLCVDPSSRHKVLWYNEFLYKRVMDFDYLKSYEKFEQEKSKEFYNKKVEDRQSNLLL